MSHHRTGPTRDHFDLSQDDIQRTCRFFAIGKLRHFEKEKGITTPHTHLFVFVSTTQGQYALKFYTPNTAHTIATEYTINRILTHHQFPTPAMHAGTDDQPFFTVNDRLITCYAYIKGTPAWQQIKERDIFPRINTAMLSLKDILSSTMGRVVSHRKNSLTATINAFTQVSRTIVPSSQRKTIDASLLHACRSYQQHRPLFTRQWTHNNATLTNFLLYKRTIYTLDLEHVWKDYVLSDLACLATSCLLLDMPFKTVKTTVNNYFSQHELEMDHFIVLNALVRIRLIRKYLNNTGHERSKGTIIALLNKMNDDPRLIV